MNAEHDQSELTCDRGGQPGVPVPALGVRPGATETPSEGSGTGEGGSTPQIRVSGTGLAELISPVLDRGLSLGPEQDASAVADAILAAGWRPPLPAADPSKPLNTEPGAITRLTVNIGPRTAEALNAVTAEHEVSLTEALRALVATGYAAARQPVGSVGERIRAVLSDPMLDEAMMLDQINTILDEPLPDSETEPDAMQWGYREHVGEDVDPVREEYARFRAQDEHLKLVQREVRFGPWIEVTS